MPKAKLTELSVARMKPPAAGRVDIWDTTLPAFGLRISATGRKIWIAAIRKPGAANPARLTVGKYPDLSLADARKKAGELMADPGAAAERPARRLDTFEALAGRVHHPACEDSP